MFVKTHLPHQTVKYFTSLVENQRTIKIIAVLTCDTNTLYYHLLKVQSNSRSGACRVVTNKLRDTSLAKPIVECERNAISVHTITVVYQSY